MRRGRRQMVWGLNRACRKIEQDWMCSCDKPGSTASWPTCHRHPSASSSAAAEIVVVRLSACQVPIPPHCFKQHVGLSKYFLRYPCGLACLAPCPYQMHNSCSCKMPPLPILHHGTCLSGHVKSSTNHGGFCKLLAIQILQTGTQLEGLHASKVDGYEQRPARQPAPQRLRGLCCSSS